MLSIILNFHGIGPVLRQIDHGERACWLEQEHFEAILDLVCKLPHVLLTFDDGNESDITVALPLLLERGLTASFFICSGSLDQPTFLSRRQVKYIQAQGMRIGSHGIAHRAWRGLSADELTAELTGSRLELEGICGKPVLEAACPFGAYGRTVLQVLRDAGYHKVFTSDGGWADGRSWLIPRNTVRRTQSVEHIRKLVSTRPSPLAQVISSSRLLLKQYL